MALEGQLVMYVCQSRKDERITKKIALGGYAYTKRKAGPDVAYWYCDQRKICGASLIERNGIFTRKEGASSSGDRASSSSKFHLRTKGSWDVDGNHEAHLPNVERFPFLKYY